MKNSAAFIMLLLLAGCASTAPFFRSVEGTSTSIGVTVPNEEVIQLEALHYLNGEKVTVRDPAFVAYKFKAGQTNSYFGIVKTVSWRESGVTVSLTNRNEEASR